MADTSRPEEGPCMEVIHNNINESFNCRGEQSDTHYPHTAPESLLGKVEDAKTKPLGTALFTLWTLKEALPKLPTKKEKPNKIWKWKSMFAHFLFVCSDCFWLFPSQIWLKVEYESNSLEPGSAHLPYRLLCRPSG